MLNHPSKGLNFNGISRREGGGERFVEGSEGDILIFSVVRGGEVLSCPF